MHTAIVALVSVSSIWSAFAAPPSRVGERQLVGEVLGGTNSLVSGVASGVAADVSNAADLFSALAQAVKDTVPTATPTSVPDAIASLSEIFASTPTNLFDNGVELVKNSFTPGDLSNIIETYSTGCNSEVNLNPRAPAEPVYPQKAAGDAPYSLSEEQLRQVIYIPPEFTYGQKPPVILVPGTGSTGCLSFGSNFIKLLRGKDYADPVWLNIPHFLLDDVQLNAEYVAYAINYIAGITSLNVSVIAWSQGNLDTQWALKYWPSTRPPTQDFISISPDFHGTQLAYAVCPSFPAVPCPPSLIQQQYNSAFITTLRSAAGDSAYVPTTSIYSATDEIVQPQSGGAGASAYLGDARGVGATNNELQVVCNGRPAGLVYTHEGVLYNPVAVALAVDALTHEGPGRVERIDAAALCGELVAEGLGLGDVLATEGNIPVALIAIALYEPKVLVEPPIMAYAA